MIIQRPGLTEEQASNSFSDEELEGMSYGNNPVANAYRELLALRQRITPNGGIRNGAFDKLRDLAEQATKGEWEAVNDGVCFGVVRLKGTNCQIAACTMHDGHPKPVSLLEVNSKYIAAAQPAAILGLLEQLGRLERMSEENSAAELRGK
ncbi:hypothetical protein [Aeromonas veronii]|uniref:hypothetical protein n=1 Tax=Aeromonas veronii TaxID=654 RepID=UPI001F260C0A|nr:hypothetical protein [Aeromonas veronii]